MGNLYANHSQYCSIGKGHQPSSRALPPMTSKVGETVVELQIDNPDVDDFQPSSSPDALMNLILRFETANGPRTVIACSVPRHVAAEVAEVMHAVGQHAAFVDRYSPLSVADRILMRDIEQIPQRETEDILRAGWEKAISTRFFDKRTTLRPVKKVA
jgi:predicted metal-dependent phosphoesterase TrpH